MTTMTDAGAASFALANKRQKDAMGRRVLATSGKGWSFVTGAASKIWGKVRGLAQAFKIDSLAAGIYNGLRTAAAKVLDGVRWAGELLGWKNLALFVVTSPEIRAEIYAAAARVGIKASKVLSWTELQVSRVPLVGKIVARGLVEVRMFVLRWTVRAVTKVEQGLAAIEDNELGSLVCDAVNAGAGLAMVDRIFKRVVPAGYRRPLMLVAAGAMFIRLGQAVYAMWKTRSVDTEHAALTEAQAAETEQVKAAAAAAGLQVVELNGTETHVEAAGKIGDAAKAAEKSRAAAEKAAARKPARV